VAALTNLHAQDTFASPNADGDDSGSYALLSAASRSDVTYLHCLLCAAALLPALVSLRHSCINLTFAVGPVEPAVRGFKRLHRADPH
jgi:hypothetical protein